jgi:hypothetical protein
MPRERTFFCHSGAVYEHSGEGQKIALPGRRGRLQPALVSWRIVRHRIRMVAQDAETEEEVSRSGLVKGYEFEKVRSMPLDDFEQAGIESSSAESQPGPAKGIGPEAACGS